MAAILLSPAETELYFLALQLHGATVNAANADRDRRCQTILAAHGVKQGTEANFSPSPDGMGVVLTISDAAPAVEQSTTPLKLVE